MPFPRQHRSTSPHWNQQANSHYRLVQIYTFSRISSCFSCACSIFILIPTFLRSSSLYISWYHDACHHNHIHSYKLSILPLSIHSKLSLWIVALCRWYIIRLAWTQRLIEIALFSQITRSAWISILNHRMFDLFSSPHLPKKKGTPDVSRVNESLFISTEPTSLFCPSLRRQIPFLSLYYYRFVHRFKIIIKKSQIACSPQYLICFRWWWEWVLIYDGFISTGLVHPLGLAYSNLRKVRHGL